jgi:endonuclease G
MTAESNESEQDAAAAARVAARTGVRDEKRAILRRRGGIADADDPVRIAKRLSRLARYHGVGDVPAVPGDVSDEDARALLDATARRVAQSPRVPAIEPATADSPGIVLERIINNSDFLEVRYLDAGQLAERAVGRIVIRDERDRDAGYGTGSLVSPRLLLTNHHVLPDAATAARSVVEFNFQDGVDRKPLQARQFGFDPAALFVTDKARDFSLVAVQATAQELAEFGFNPLIAAEGKAIIGEYVTIVQHPGGEKKQLVLRDQQIVDVPEDFLHYMADTAPGSSGSPVFNDQWEVVALHHASVRAPASTPVDGGFVNEGVRVSRILRALAEQQLGAAQQQLVDGLAVHTAAPPPVPPPDPPESLPMPDPTPTPAPPPGTSAPATATTQDGWVTITVPLEIRLRLGAPVAGVQVTAAPAVFAPATPAAGAGALESVVIDPDFAAREGFDTAFLGAGHDVALPQLSPAQQALASVDTTATAAPSNVLRYHHYSVVMNSERRLAFWVGVNIDGALHTWRKQLARTKDKWFFDPRIPRDEQVGEEMYTKNALDRGHLVRRLDPAWGPDLDTAKKANDDTFHFTNCTPQHEDFNQNKTTWAGLEDYILDNAGKSHFKASVFTGPVLADDDDLYRGVKLPRQFWKVVTMVKEDGTLSATGYLLSQERLIEGLESDEPFSYGAYKTFQVKVADVAQLTGLSFGALPEADPLEHLESTGGLIEITSPESLVL